MEAPTLQYAPHIPPLGQRDREVSAPSQDDAPSHYSNGPMGFQDANWHYPVHHPFSGTPAPRRATRELSPALSADPLPLYSQTGEQYPDPDPPRALSAPFSAPSPAHPQLTGLRAVAANEQVEAQSGRGQWLRHAAPVMDYLNVPLQAQPTQAPFNHPTLKQDSTNRGDQTTNNIHHVEQGNFGTNFGTLISNSYTAHYTSDVLWESLPRRQDTSGHGSKYLEGSRDEDVAKIRNWVETASSELALWIYGPAGLGKSTLAREVSRDLRTVDRLGAFVPLNTLPHNARGPETVVKMIAREIGETYPQAIPAITSAIAKSKGMPVRDQVEILIGEPIRALRRSSTVVVVLDAFDEWEFGDVLIREMDCLAPLRPTLKIIILSRSDPKSLGHQHRSIMTYPLQSVSKAVMVQYFNMEFEAVKWDDGRKPSTMDVSRLVDQADGLFIWASVVCSLLGKGFGISSPNATLEAIVHSTKKIGETGRLGTLYSGALDLLFPDPDDRDVVRRYLSAVLILREPLSFGDFSSLTSIPLRSLDAIQSRLKALDMRAPANNSSAMVYRATDSFHLSFVEYLQHSSTSTPPTSFAAPSEAAHLELAKGCLKELTGLPSTWWDRTCLSQKQVYAVRNWTSHFSDGASWERRSDLDRMRSQLWSYLSEIPFAAFCRWGFLALDAFFPDVVQRDGFVACDNLIMLLQTLACCLDYQDPVALSLRISSLCVAACLQANDAGIWHHLGTSYATLAQISSSSDCLHNAVAAFENAVVAGANLDVPVQGHLLSALGLSLTTRFHRFGVMQDLDQAITLGRHVLAHQPPDHPDRPPNLGKLAHALEMRFGVTRSLKDLQEAILLLREHLTFYPPGHPCRSLSLISLSGIHNSRFEATGSFQDLHLSIALTKEALEVCPSPPGDITHTGLISSLAYLLHSRFRVTQCLEDLQEAISLQRKVFALVPTGDFHRSYSFNNLADSLHSRFEATNSLADLQESIALHKEALSLRPPGDLHRSLSLYNLARSLHSRSKLSASRQDLEEAIVFHREALILRPPGHLNRSKSLNDLALALESRSRITGSAEDTQEADALKREAITSPNFT